MATTALISSGNHPDSAFPNSQAGIARIFSDTPPEVVQKVTRDNAANLYGFREDLKT